MDDAIRQQVDYYFSSENLTADRFLLSKMKGSKNKPIPLYVIHGFKKMRDYQPLLAVAKALLLSSNVNVYKEGDTWYVQRKEPFQKDGAKDQDSQAPPKKVNIIADLFETCQSTADMSQAKESQQR